jgi:carboxyl-terminal processing protease
MGIYLYTSDGSIASGLIVANSDFSKLEKKLYSGAKKTELSKPLPADYNYSFVYGEVVKLIKDNYVEEVEQQKFFDSALNGMLTSLDPHSSYFPKDEYNQLLADTEGEFSGIGIEVMMENQMVKVVTPIDDTPAFNAGIKSGDYIAYINDKPVV